MGWKTFKEKFNIGHIVSVEKNKILIGGEYRLAAIEMASGKVIKNGDYSSGFFAKYYPAILAASPDEILSAIKADDVFDQSITVYTFKDGDILEKQCEHIGYPNVTHDGQLMYDNRFDADKNKVIKWAKEENNYAIEAQKELIVEIKEKLARHEKYLAEYEADRAKLDLL